MKMKLASLLGLLVLVALASGMPATARADDKSSIALGRACGQERYGHSLHLQFSKNEELCVYPTNNADCTKESCCDHPMLSPADKTSMWDKRNQICKQISGMQHLICGGQAAVFYTDSAPASSVAGVAGFAVATASGGGQICLTASGPYSGTQPYTGPCGIPNTTALYISLNAAGRSQGLSVTPDAAKIPGYGNGTVNGLGTFACVAASKPTFKDVPDPAIGRFIPPQ